MVNGESVEESSLADDLLLASADELICLSSLIVLTESVAIYLTHDTALSKQVGATRHIACLAL